VTSSTITILYGSTGKPAKYLKVVLSILRVISGGISKTVVADNSGNVTNQHEIKDGTADGRKLRSDSTVFRSNY